LHSDGGSRTRDLRADHPLTPTRSVLDELCAMWEAKLAASGAAGVPEG